MQMYDHIPHVIVMDIRAFLLSNKTTKGLKRASDDSAGGSASTCKSSSKRNGSGWKTFHGSHTMLRVQ